MVALWDFNVLIYWLIHAWPLLSSSDVWIVVIPNCQEAVSDTIYFGGDWFFSSNGAGCCFQTGVCKRRTLRDIDIYFLALHTLLPVQNRELQGCQVQEQKPSLCSSNGTIYFFIHFSFHFFHSMIYFYRLHPSSQITHTHTDFPHVITIA